MYHFLQEVFRDPPPPKPLTRQRILDYYLEPQSLWAAFNLAIVTEHLSWVRSFSLSSLHIFRRRPQQEACPVPSSPRPKAEHLGKGLRRCLINLVTI